MARNLPSSIRAAQRVLLRMKYSAEYRCRFPFSEKFLNEREMRVYGVQRSGNHAIINWIVLNTPGTVLFLNNIRQDLHFNPFLTFGEATLKSDRQLIEVPMRMPQKRRTVRDWHRKNPTKDLLIFSYENRSLQTVPRDDLSVHHDRCVGVSKRQQRILILRDPFNCFASHFRRHGVVRPVIVERWIAYAREFLNETSYLPDRVTVSYNKWCDDAEYREKLAECLGLNTTDAGVMDVPKIGGGSSFDATRYNGQAQAMRTDERWRSFQDDPAFRSLFKNPAIVTLSRRIFGELSADPVFS